MRIGSARGAIGLGLLTTGLGSAHAYEYLDVNPPGSVETQVDSINSSGAVVDEFNLALSSPFQGFIESTGIYTSINPPGSTDTYIHSISNAGAVAGAFLDSRGFARGFVESGGAYTVLTAPGAADTYAFGINDSGAVTGYAGFGNAIAGMDAGFIETGGSYTVFQAPGASSTYPWASMLPAKSRAISSIRRARGAAS